MRSTRSPEASTRSAARCLDREAPFFAYFWSKTKYCTAFVGRKVGGGRTCGKDYDRMTSTPRESEGRRRLTFIMSFSNLTAVVREVRERCVNCLFHSVCGSRLDNATIERAECENKCTCWLACRMLTAAE